MTVERDLALGTVDAQRAKIDELQAKGMQAVCLYCNRTLPKAEMLEHLKSCGKELAE